MITLEATRKAILSGDPYTEMDRLVRHELAAGRNTDQITSDFRPWLDAALDTPNLPTDGEEALLSALDALTGNCRADQCYQDPPQATLPTDPGTARSVPEVEPLPAS